ncbi:MAG: hypothetical protein A4E64_00839 [Syntrophorhabdus sp. PtaU1.Bin058]|nr:MAG: hypothetical protein A4E64_00839 [Syntrophorhabdus sp. PtaU1.Bin058]
MGFIDILLRRRHLLSYRLVFDSNGRISVNVSPSTPSLPDHEYIRLWSYFYTESMRVLNYPENITALLSLATLEKIVDKPFDALTDCFDRAGLSDNLHYTEEAVPGDIVLTGDFYSKDMRRILAAQFPAGISDNFAVYGGVGLLQYSINRCRENSDDLRIVHNTVENLIFLFKGKNDTVNSFPDTAYALAAGSFNSPGRD